jgi:hypothetical protein
VVYYTGQLRAELNAATTPGSAVQRRKLVVFVVTDDASTVRPSGPLADKASVIHWSQETQAWSMWTIDPTTETGGWQNISRADAQELVGSQVPAAVP